MPDAKPGSLSRQIQSAKYEAIPRVRHYGGPSDLAAPLSVQNYLPDLEQATIAELATALLADPLAVEQLSQRVFELLKEELYYAQERCRGYGR
ncbi:MAG: hypothetical protein HC886_10560 [Leptolyngbyaceae cyanobacterium SM1_1_3]|nr:hypothetical protein [Leptolyngbyaceae cyanobacterium SM1_1_3]NJN03587.1 hypothetical protein [Leptolyngbyaceae cyanobacterium RM1_1_2]NJO09464.1 hypothetical protein [Leptolyngbyaceae cyanobacterium SL_1_1]